MEIAPEPQPTLQIHISPDEMSTDGTSVCLEVDEPKENINPKDVLTRRVKPIPDSKTLDYFDNLYQYPPKIKLRMLGVDGLKKESSRLPDYSYILDLFDDSEALNEAQENWSTEIETKNLESAAFTTYKLDQYTDGVFNRINSSGFFAKETTQIQNTIANIPIFVVLNGQGEIVLGKPQHVLGSKNLKTLINEKFYNAVGSFDPLVEKKQKLGLFFMSYGDADNFLKSVAQADFQGTSCNSLCIHCIGLDSAYKIIREYHPGTDFRFVPNFEEIKELLLNDLGPDDDMIYEDEQQQLRYNYRKWNRFPYLKKLGRYLSPTCSFLQRNEYFKGVPIYIVQLTDTPKNFFASRYFQVMSHLDGIYSRCIQYGEKRLGFGNTWIMQGSLKTADNPTKFENFIFFEKTQAKEFYKKNWRKAVHYKGSRITHLESLVRKPKIFVYNLEDFLEDWEDSVLNKYDPEVNSVKTMFTSNATHFIPPSIDLEVIANASKEVKQNFITNLNQSLNIKFNVLKRAIGVFFSL